MVKEPDRTRGESDFAQTVRQARERLGLRQAELARRCRLTPAYLSLLERRKKPPPSDEVVERLAENLGMARAELLRLAHLDRAPRDVQRRLRRLEGGLRRQKGINRRLVEGLLSYSLFNVAGPEGYLEAALSSLGRELRSGGPIGRLFRRLRQARSVEDVRSESRKALEKLSDRDWEALLGVLEEARPAASPATLPVFREVPPPPWDEAGVRPAGQAPVLPGLHGPRRYFFAVTGEAMYPRLEDGDLLLADEALPARNGDIVLVRFGDEGLAAKYLALGDAVEFAPANPGIPPRRFPREEEARGTFRICATGVELRRSLR